MVVSVSLLSEQAKNVSEVTDSPSQGSDVLLDLLVCGLFVAALLSTAEVIRSMISSAVYRHRLLANSNGMSFTYDAMRTTDVDMTYEALLALSDTIGHVNVGLSQEQIDLMPSCTYRKDFLAGMEEGRDSRGTSATSPMCAICREDLEDGDELLILPCHCQFHKKCITRWLESNFSCPLCRSSFA